jgi:hypothetical protein
LQAYPGEAAAINSRFGRLIAEAQAKLSGPLTDTTFDATVVHAGTSSIYWTSMTYNYDFSQLKDPTNVMFYGVGGGYEAEYAMRNWTRNDSNHRWEDASGSGCTTEHQWEGLKNDAYADYWWARAPLDPANGNGWRRNLQVVADTCRYDSRHHVRLFGTPVHDPDFGNWSIGAAHFEDWDWGDPTGGHIINSWEEGDWRVQQSFRQSDNGPLLWFVETIYYGSFSNEGTYQGVYTDGQGTVIKLR